jgi:hypothetical protein
MAREEFEQDADRMLEATRMRIPILALHDAIERADLEIFLHIDGEDVLSGAVNRQAHTERQCARRFTRCIWAAKSCS